MATNRLITLSKDSEHDQELSHVNLNLGRRPLARPRRFPAAFAQDKMGKETMSKDDMAKDTMSRDGKKKG